MLPYFGVKAVHTLPAAGGDPVFLLQHCMLNKADVLMLCMQSVTKLWQLWVLPTV